MLASERVAVPVVVMAKTPPAPPVPALLATPVVIRSPSRLTLPLELIVMPPDWLPAVAAVVVMLLPLARSRPPLPALRVTRPLEPPAVVAIEALRSTVAELIVIAPVLVSSAPSRRKVPVVPLG